MELAYQYSETSCYPHRVHVLESGNLTSGDVEAILRSLSKHELLQSLEEEVDWRWGDFPSVEFVTEYDASIFLLYFRPAS